VTVSQLSSNTACICAAPGPVTRICMSRQMSGWSPWPRHASAMPTPPVKATRPSTISSLRWVRLLMRSMSYQRSGWKYSKCTPPARRACTTSSCMRVEPTQSASTCTRTPARARSVSAATNWREISPDQ
jgi:hypothetical protein